VFEGDFAGSQEKVFL